MNADMPELIFGSPDAVDRDVLVLLHLDGGMDGLHLVPPLGDSALQTHRRQLQLGEPGRTGGVLDLDGRFGLHPRLEPLRDLFRAKRLAIVHACGSPDRSLSHFEAMQTMESGARDSRELSNGWLSRHLALRANAARGPLRAVAFGKSLPRVLGGSADATVISSLSDVRLDVPSNWDSQWPAVLREFYSGSDDPPARHGRDTLRLIDDLRMLQRDTYRPEGNTRYGDSDLGATLRQVAQLIKADVGLEAAVVRQGGWDSHRAQQPQLDGLMSALSESLRAFHDDLGARMQRVTLVALTEFGRRARENGAAGTDHGRGSAMFLVGGGVRGGHVFGRWPGVEPDQLDRDGNLRVTTDYRHVLGEVVARRLGNSALDAVFPRFTPEFLNCCEPAST
jgi:uncharacterized protein (DUF1501 family)